MKYHPDRNPGKEVEFNSKFQAIQSANEVLTDPHQRAKYDAQRIRSGLLHSYPNSASPPPRPNVPPRAQTTKFPPPPPRPPPPPSATRPSFSPPPTGPQKYARFNRPEPTTHYGATSPDDAKSKTNDFKAWEQMRHGQGPLPPRRPVPPRSPKTTTFEAERPAATGRGVHTNSSARRSAPWENLQDAGMPSFSRSSTSRAPPMKPGLSQNTSTRDDPSPRSAYFNVSRGERPSTSRAHTNMGPPQAPTAKMPDPIRFSKTQAGLDPFSNSTRVSTPYHMNVGEKTKFNSSGLHRSSTTATPRDSNSRTGFYDSDSLHPKSQHVRATSTGSAQRKPNVLPHMYSSTESSSSSGEAETEMLYTRQRPTQVPKSRRRAPAGAGQHPPFTSRVRMDDTEWEGMAPHENLYTGPRRHSGIDIPTQKVADDHPKGFVERRTEDEAAKSQSPPGAQPRPMPRHKSFDEKYSSPRQDKDGRGVSGDQNGIPMYDNPACSFFTPPSFGSPSFGPSPSALYTSSGPFSEKWSDQWPFNSLKRARTTAAAPPPYWAIPSSLPPGLAAAAHKRAETTSSAYMRPHVTMPTCANDTLFNSFHWHMDEKPTPPLRSQSSETINMNFSPSETPPKFGADKSFFPPPPSDQSSNDGGPTQKAHTFPMENPSSPRASSKIDSNTEESASPTSIPPPPKDHSKYSSDHWHGQFDPGTFEFPPSRSTSRAANRKRAAAPRTSSMNSAKRSGTFKAGAFQPSVTDPNDEPPAYSSNNRDSVNSSATPSSRVSSRESGGGSPMDIDPVLTPPSANDNKSHTNGNAVPSKQADGPTPRRAPTLPPRSNGHPETDCNPSNLNFGVFKNVAPFGPSNEGLDDIDDLKTALPFESRASPTKPTFSKTSQRDLAFPPVPPSPPIHLTDPNLRAYFEKMTSYMHNWRDFNGKMLTHFQIRQSAQEASCNWMSAIGRGGYDGYVQGLEEDEKARAHWEVACEKHKNCVQSLGMVRDQKLLRQMN